MVNKMLQMAVKRFGLDKYVTNVQLVDDDTPANTDFRLKINKTKYGICFDVAVEYKDELAVLVNLLS